MMDDVRAAELLQLFLVTWPLIHILMARMGMCNIVVPGCMFVQLSCGDGRGAAHFGSSELVSLFSPGLCCFGFLPV